MRRGARLLKASERDPEKRSFTQNQWCPQCPKQQNCPFADLVRGGESEGTTPVLFTHYRPGQYIYTQNGPMNGLHVVCAGAVMVQVCNEEGVEYGLHLVGAGGCLNATDVLSKRAVYSASAKVLSDANIAFLSQTELQCLLPQHPAFSFKLLYQVSEQLQLLEEQQIYLAHGNACERMLHLMQRLTSLGIQHSVDGVTLPATLDRADIASLVATTPETISRLMTRLQKAGLVQSRENRTQVLDMNRLKRATCCE